MRVEPLGDAAAIVRQIACPGYALAEEVRKLGLPGVTDIVPSFDTVGVMFDPDALTLGALTSKLGSIDDSSLAGGGTGVLHRIPVCYELGEDLAEVCGALELTRDAFIALHCGQPYRCYAVGFVPGFAYLGYLPEPISGSVRRPSPRLKVAKGSVGIAGRQTGIYPIDCPGGWQLVGWTPVDIVAEGDRFLIAPGDQVEFYAVSAMEVGR